MKNTNFTKYKNHYQRLSTEEASELNALTCIQFPLLERNRKQIFKFVRKNKEMEQNHRKIILFFRIRFDSSLIVFSKFSLPAKQTKLIISFFLKQQLLITNGTSTCQRI
jgi:hypothetical protein